MVLRLSRNINSVYAKFGKKPIPASEELFLSWLKQGEFIASLRDISFGEKRNPLGIRRALEFVHLAIADEDVREMERTSDNLFRRQSIRRVDLRRGAFRIREKYSACEDSLENTNRYGRQVSSLNV